MLRLTSSILPSDTFGVDFNVWNLITDVSK